MQRNSVSDGNYIIFKIKISERIKSGIRFE